ncbi:MAG: RagB/SusD family nutrient uptake outer membrane protein [Winogradskyella sp.]|uniref:RagB/SusD family nutrient uptake outer membrane protein n=1 Tax=Winogradskyella sp. TaxID=1883156 RepID=UPI00385DC4C5
MKKNIFSLICLVTISLFLGCEDSYEIDQVGRLDAANAFRTVEDLQSGLLGVYRQLDVTPEMALSANFTDEVAPAFDSGGQGFQLYDFIINAASAASTDFWVRNYRVNNRATLLIDAANNITPEAGEESDYNNILGQAHFIRAWANFELLLYFSTDPTNDAVLAAPIVAAVPDATVQPRRNTTGEMWDFINSEIAIAQDLVETQSNPTFVSVDAINAFRARLALTRGDYASAEALASQLLNSYGLANQTQYTNMWFDNDNTEIIWKLERTLNDAYDGQGSTGSVFAGGWAGAVFAFVDATFTGGAYFEMDRSIFDALLPGDIRRDVMVAPSSIISSDYLNDPDPVNNDVLIIQKYQGSEGQPLMNDLKIFRSSEMLLIAAEARAYQNNLSGAASLIQQLRNARFGTTQPLPTYGSSQEAIGAVLDERKIELAFEGHRYKDLKRSGIAGNRGIDRDVIACEIQSGACTLSADDFRFSLPIPITEINANPGIAEQQNPGY